MSEPSWASYFLRLGAVFTIFVVAIMVASAFFPGSEGYVVIGVSVVGVCALAMRELWSRKGSARNSNRGKNR